MSTAESIYQSSVVGLPKSEQLKLAALILDELSTSGAVLDFSDSWSEEDVGDVTAYAADYAAGLYGEEPDCA